MNFIFVNGCYRSDISSPGSLAECVQIKENVFTLYLPKKFYSKAPIYFVHVNKNTASKPVQHRIILDEGAQATMLQSYQGRPNLIYCSQIETEVELKANARLYFYKWQREGNQARHEAKFSAQQACHSYLGTYHVVRGSQLANEHFTYALSGPGASCESLGFYQGRSEQQLNIKSDIQHKTSNTNSHQWYKGIAEDRSHVRFHGKVFVDPNIQAIDANQRNNNLLLSQDAQIDTQPELEIYSDEVRCSHGATIGQLDEASLFFLRSRGIEETVARTLLTEGFASEIFNAFPNTELANLIRGDS